MSHKSLRVAALQVAAGAVGLTCSKPEEALHFVRAGFDVIEVFNGKRYDMLETYRVPETLPPPPLCPTRCHLLRYCWRRRHGTTVLAVRATSTVSLGRR